MDSPKRVEAASGRATFGQALAAVFWSFFGVRKGSDLERDAARLNPLHVVMAAVIGVALVVLALLLIVHAVVG